MHERILVSPNGTELLRMLARNGFPTFGLRVMSPLALARFALMRSGIAQTETLISPADEAALICRILPEIPYFESASYQDAQKLADTLRELRLQVISQERDTIVNGLKSSEFTEKNEALLTVYDQYLHLLEDRHYMDTVGMLRLALEKAGPLDAECMALTACPLMPLEQALLSRVSGGSYRAVSVHCLMGKPEQQMPLPCITEAYGAANEAEAVIGDVFARKLPPDQCTIAVSDAAAYVPLLFELTSRFDIPATFGCGLPITLSRAATVLSDYQHWQTDGLFGIDALHALVCGSAFETDAFCEDFGIADRQQLHTLLQAAGSLRLSTDTARNQTLLQRFQSASRPEPTLVTQLQSIFVDFGMQCPKLLQRYTRIRKHEPGILDKAAVQKICDTMERYAALTGEPADLLIPDLLQSRICVRNSHEGALHITTISGAVTALRSNLFVMGLSAEKFPGKPKENYLLLDHELAAFGEAAPTSHRRIEQTKEALLMLLQTAAALDIPAKLSYCGYDTAELKMNNASSILYALYQAAGGADEAGFHEAIRHTGYFEQNLPGAAEIGRAFLKGETTEAAPRQPELSSEETEGSIPKLSPSAIEVYLQCPKRFCFERIMYIREQETDDPMEVISHAGFGELVHQAMELLCGQPMEKEEFLRHAEAIFAAFLAERPPLREKDAEISRKDFLRAAEQGYDWAQNRKLTAAEQKIEVEYPCGFTLTGRPDALEELPDGRLRVIDYKTGLKVHHKKDDPVSCIQVMLYADMLQRSGKNMTGGEYWYLRHEIIPCSYTQECAGLITTILDRLAEDIRQHHFPANPSQDNCRYCACKSICEEGRAVR